MSGANFPTYDMTQEELSTYRENIADEMETIDTKIKLLQTHIEKQGKFQAPVLSSTKRAHQRGPLCCGGIHAEQDLHDAEHKPMSAQERLMLLEQGKLMK